MRKNSQEKRVQQFLRYGDVQLQTRKSRRNQVPKSSSIEREAVMLTLRNVKERKNLDLSNGGFCEVRLCLFAQLSILASGFEEDSLHFRLQRRRRRRRRRRRKRRKPKIENRKTPERKKKRRVEKYHFADSSPFELHKVFVSEQTSMTRAL